MMAGVTLTLQDYGRMAARDRDDLILLRVGLDERRAREENEAVKKAKRTGKRGR